MIFAKQEKTVSHKGVFLSTNFLPDHPRPKLNVVHGPNAVKEEVDEEQMVELIEKESSTVIPSTMDIGEEDTDMEVTERSREKAVKAIAKKKRREMRKNSVVRSAGKSNGRHGKNSRKRSFVMKTRK